MWKKRIKILVSTCIWTYKRQTMYRMRGSIRWKWVGGPIDEVADPNNPVLLGG